MIVIKSAKDLYKHINKLRLSNSKIGFVATMGALHQGHVSLIKRSKMENDTTICSIFVNPKQFNDPEDLKKYPRPIENDIILLTEAQTDVLYLPSVDDIFPNNYIEPQINLNGLDTILEGAMRPGHFKGVALVVKRLLDIVTPDKAYFGQKDFQQTLVIKQIVEQFNLPIQIIVTDIIREESGLAMSSRNIRLNDQARLNAGFIFKALQMLKTNISQMGLKEALQLSQHFILQHEGTLLEYFSVVNPMNLHSMESIRPHEKALALIVVNYMGVRLLDNLYLN